MKCCYPSITASNAHCKTGSVWRWCIAVDLAPGAATLAEAPKRKDTCVQLCALPHHMPFETEGIFDART